MDLIYKIYSVWLYQDQLKHRVWKPGSSQYTTYRICEEKENRITAIRDYKLNQII